MFELVMNSPVMVRMIRKHLRREAYGTYFQEKRRTARGHKAGGYVNLKQKDSQQEADR